MVQQGDTEKLVSAANHQPCDDCGSRDALTRNVDGSTKCYSCQKFTPGNRNNNEPIEVRRPDGTFVSGGTYYQIPRRNLTEETCRKWGYQIATVGGEDVQVANYRSRDGKLVGQKIRSADKRFSTRGELLGLYGQHLWRDGGKRVVVVEGEVDALSLSQAFDHKWPVVSVPHGAGSGKKHVAQALDWLERYDEVVFMFDMDEPGPVSYTHLTLPTNA